MALNLTLPFSSYTTIFTLPFTIDTTKVGSSGISVTAPRYSRCALGRNVSIGLAHFAGTRYGTNTGSRWTMRNG